MRHHKTQEEPTIQLELDEEMELLGLQTHYQNKLQPWSVHSTLQPIHKRPLKPKTSKWSQTKRQQFRSNLIQLKKEFDFLLDSERQEQASEDNTKIPKFPTQPTRPAKLQKKLSIIDCKTVQVIASVKPFKTRNPVFRRKDPINISQITIKTPNHSPRFQSRLIHSSLQSEPVGENNSSLGQKAQRKESIEYVKKKQWEKLHRRVKSMTTESPEKERSRRRGRGGEHLQAARLSPTVVAYSRPKPSINSRHLNSYLFNRIRNSP